MTTPNVLYYKPGPGFCDHNDHTHSDPIFCVERIIKSDTSSANYVMNDNGQYTLNEKHNVTVSFNACFWTSEETKNVGHAPLALVIDNKKLFQFQLDESTTDTVEEQCYTKLKELVDERIASA